MLRHRIQRLRELIKAHEPQAVVFYSRKYLDYWCQIVGIEKKRMEVKDLCDKKGKELPAAFYRNGQTVFVVTYHPVAFGVTNRYFERVGRLLNPVASYPE